MGPPEISENHHRLYPSTRLCMFLLVLFGSTVLGGGFGAFNFAIVCMVNETAISLPSECQKGPSNATCGLSDSTSGSELGGGYNGEFAWDKATQAHLLAAHAFGAIILNVPSGLISDRFGSKIVITACVVLNAIASAVTPISAYAGVSWLFFVRMLQGRLPEFCFSKVTNQFFLFLQNHNQIYFSFQV